MNLLKSFQEKVGFTRNETRTIAILVITFLVGTAIRAYRQHGSLSETPRYDYTRSDSIFGARSFRVDSLDSFATTTQRPTGSKGLGAGECLNINAAPENELMRLPGIGPSIARRIVEHRKQHGPFRKVDDLLRVKGIGAKKLEKLRPWINTLCN